MKVVLPPKRYRLAARYHKPNITRKPSRSNGRRVNLGLGRLVRL